MWLQEGSIYYVHFYRLTLLGVWASVYQDIISQCCKVCGVSAFTLNKYPTSQGLQEVTGYYTFYISRLVLT